MDLPGEVGLTGKHERLFVGLVVAAADVDGAVVDTDDADNDDDPVMTMMMRKVAGKPTVNETIPLNTYCGYRNST